VSAVPRRPLGAERGFTLLEALVAVLVVSIIVTAVGYGIGLSGDALREQREELRRALLIEAKMAEIDATSFYSVAGGKDSLDIDGRVYWRFWTVVPADGDGDGYEDPGLYLVTVRVENDSCQTLKCDVE
jgi:prepilin-type N-terminal cleavage/methylation domain-containing protein